MIIVAQTHTSTYTFASQVLNVSASFYQRVNRYNSISVYCYMRTRMLAQKNGWSLASTKHQMSIFYHSLLMLLYKVILIQHTCRLLMGCGTWSFNIHVYDQFTVVFVGKLSQYFLKPVMCIVWYILSPPPPPGGSFTDQSSKADWPPVITRVRINPWDSSQSCFKIWWPPIPQKNRNGSTGVIEM